MCCFYVVSEYVYVNGQFIVYTRCMFVFFLGFVSYFVCFGLSECDAFFDIDLFYIVNNGIHHLTLLSIHQSASTRMGPGDLL